jgi:hypothetical protein
MAGTDGSDTPDSFSSNITSRIRSSAASGRDDVGKGTTGIEFHLHHLAHRITARKPPAQTGSHQQIADLHIFIVGNMRQFQLLKVAGTQGQGANPGAIDLDRQGVVGVGDEDGRGGKGIGPDDLADDAMLVEYRLPT